MQLPNACVGWRRQRVTSHNLAEGEAFRGILGVGIEVVGYRNEHMLLAAVQSIW